VALFVLSQNIQLSRNQVTTRNQETGRTNTGKEEILAATCTQHVIRKSSQAVFILSADKKASRKTKKKIL
jgi:hypothetical protein